MILQQCMVMNNLKLINAQHPKITHACKNMKKKLHITNATIWVNEEKKSTLRNSHSQPFKFTFSCMGRQAAHRINTYDTKTCFKQMLYTYCLYYVSAL